jgi:predicted RNA-binding Zn ribbon-like protein
MAFEWTEHRFAGGALALDIANSVILRHDCARSIDRFAEPGSIPAFCEAAARFCADRDLFGPLDPVRPDDRDDFLELRESIDTHFRANLRGGADPLALADLLERCAAILRRHPFREDRLPLDLATATSAIALLSADGRRKMKICRHCGWLFLDRSRNASRTWCDMKVCGNRVKARRFYHKTLEAQT